jgi:SynChlorMet cassette protein ScmD
MFDSAAKPRMNLEMVVRQEGDDWALLYDPATGSVFGLHPVSVFICGLLDGNHTVESVSYEVKRHFCDVPPESESDIHDFIENLIDNGLASY